MDNQIVKAIIIQNGYGINDKIGEIICTLNYLHENIDFYPLNNFNLKIYCIGYEVLKMEQFTEQLIHDRSKV